MQGGVNVGGIIPKMIAGERYPLAIVCRFDGGIQCCSEDRGFLFDVLRI